MNIDIENMTEVLKRLPAQQAVLIRGPHGIGKSQIVQALGEHYKCPVLDVRLSQMSEGDFLGLPKLHEPVVDKGVIVKNGKTEFLPPDWYVTCMEQRVVLLLDELNRAIPEVMQCSFQLILDRQVMGKAVHPDVRIIACVNSSHHYQVNEMDPALLDRFAVFDLSPNIENWVQWAKENDIDHSIIEFCRQNVTSWWHNPAASKGLENSKVYPTPRSWEMLNRALREADMFGEVNNPLFRFVSMSLVGDEAGAFYHEFVKNYDRQISAEDIMDNYRKVKERVKLGMPIEQLLTIIDKLQNAATKPWSKAQVKNIAQFVRNMGNDEMVFKLWTAIAGTAGAAAGENTIAFHGACAKEILRAASGNAVAK